MVCVCDVYVCACVCACASALQNKLAKGMALSYHLLFSPQMVRVFMTHTQKNKRSETGYERDIGFLICHTDTVNISQQHHFLEKAQPKAKGPLFR